MKNKFLFSTLIMAAAFSACSQEDIVVNNENVSSFEEVVGANLLGEGLAIRVGNSNESRATATGWEKGVDVAGLGWVVKGAPESDQSNVELIEVGNNIYANHFYQYEGEGIWSTKSNIYEGWHFAYFPYAHKTRPGALSFTVNDKVYSGGEYMADLRNNSLYLSGAIHLNANNVDEANGTIEASFNITRVVNALYPTLQIDEAFTGHEELQKISIKNFTVGITDKSKFAKTINVVPSKLPVGDIESVDALYADGALVAGEYGKSITTTLAKDAFKLDKNQLMRIFMAPVKKQWNNKVKSVKTVK